MFINIAEFPPIKQGKEEDFLAWFAWSNDVYESFDGFISRRLLRATDVPGTYAGMVEHESRETFMAMHLSEERKKAWERVAPLLEGKAKPHFYEEVMRTVKKSGY
jgi:heme-degrading monooxygenase HmoA